MAKDNKNGQMDPCILANGRRIRRMVKELYFILMVTSMKVNGSMIKLMALGYTCISTVPSMRASGSMINNRDRERKNGRTGLFIKGPTIKVKSTGKEKLNFPMDRNMKGIFTQTISMVTENM
jgi:hypothetical protein